MYINITTFIQIINFVITYWFLKKFFFSPFLAFLEKKKQKEQTLVSFLKREKVVLEDLEKTKIDSLLTFQKHIAATYRIPKKSSPFIEEFIIPETPLSSLKNMINQTEDCIVKTISKGC